jgi:hypothetical protein
MNILKVVDTDWKHFVLDINHKTRDFLLDVKIPLLFDSLFFWYLKPIQIMEYD